MKNPFKFNHLIFYILPANPSISAIPSRNLDQNPRQAISDSPLRQGLAALTRLFAIAALVSVLSAGIWLAYERLAPENLSREPISQNFISNQELEAKYGIRVELIATLFAGGVVDFRFRVVDPEKAKTLVHHHSKPELTLTDSGLVLRPANMGMKHHMRLKKNGVISTFYPNVQGAVKPGTLISAAFDQVKIEAIPVQ